MSKGLRLNLYLLLAAVLLSLLVWYAQRQVETRLTTLDPAAISRIEINDLSGQPVRLQKIAGVWRTEDGPARTNRIEQLLGICSTASLDNFAAPADLRSYGLDPAPIRLTLNDETLDFGTTDPLHGWRYVRYRDRIHLIADGFYLHLNAPADAWRETP